MEQMTWSWRFWICLDTYLFRYLTISHRTTIEIIAYSPKPERTKGESWPQRRLFNRFIGGHGACEQRTARPLREEADANAEGLVDLLLSRKVISSTDVAQAKAAHFGYEFVSLSTLRLPDDVIKAVPRHVASVTTRFRIQARHSIAIALADPSDLDAIDSLQRMLNAEIELRVPRVKTSKLP